MEQFIVSARKYRPATFASVVGQQHITSTLKNAIERGQLAHAYLFCGPRGVGKTTCARIFAKSINCPNAKEGEACNECESCLSVASGTSMYIHELDAASNNSVDDIRKLIDEVRVIPQGAKYSVFIIDEVHMLSQQAFNAFLKTLEEPPQHAIFILATTEKHKIIPTILSRCQIFDFNRIKVEDVVGYLRTIAEKEGVTYDEESLNLIAQKADGGMRDALSMFDKSVSFCDGKLDYHSVASSLNILDYDTYFGLTDILNSGDYVSALLEFDRVLSKGFSAQTFLQGLDKHMRDLLVSKGPAVTLVDYTSSLLNRYKTQASKCSEGFLFGAVDLLTSAEEKVRYSSNSRLLTELTIMKISQLGQKKNDLLTVDREATYPLPELQTPAAAEVKSVKEERKVEPSAKTQVSPAPVASAAEESPAKSVPTPESIITEIETAKASSQRTGSLSQLLKQVSDTSAATGNNGNASTDPLGQQKLNDARSSIVESIRQSHPRMLPAFENMTVDGSTVHLTVPTQALSDEIIRERDSLVKLIADQAGIVGTVKIEVEINETEVRLKPTKLEDKIQHIKQNSPELDGLIKSLELEIE